MTYSYTRKQTGLALSCGFALGIACCTARAEIPSTDAGYLVAQPGMVVRNGTGGCWRTGTGPGGMLRKDCVSNSLAVQPGAATNHAAQPVAKVAPATKPARQPVDGTALAVQPASQPAASVVAATAAVPKRTDWRSMPRADTLFDFNKATLRPAERMALDDFAAEVRDINPAVITAVGHADRFGPERYNQLLSEQRAQAVKAYLVSKGVDPGRIRTAGKGATQPVTWTGECIGARSTRMIACLQPDRSVEIEVAGPRVAGR